MLRLNLVCSAIRVDVLLRNEFYPQAGPYSVDGYDT